MTEEIGRGTSWLPADVRDILAIDIAPTGNRQASDERKVTVFCRDSRYPYHWEIANELRAAAIRAGVNYVMDVFTPHYGSDGDTSIAAGWDVRHAAIGPGTSNSHGYERTRMDALQRFPKKHFCHIEPTMDHENAIWPEKPVFSTVSRPSDMKTRGPSNFAICKPFPLTGGC